MPDVPYHAWTHRPKSLGGTDPIEMPGPLPAVVCSGSSAVIPELDNYSLTILDGATFGSFTGIMDTITIANDPADGSGVWAMGGTPPTRLRIHNGYYAVHYEAGIVISSGEYTGDVVLLFYGPGLANETPVTGVHTIQEPDTSQWTATHTNVVVRGSGIAVVNAGLPTSTPDTDIVGLIVLQETGADITVAQSWCYMTAMPLTNLTTFP